MKYCGIITNLIIKKMKKEKTNSFKYFHEESQIEMFLIQYY